MDIMLYRDLYEKTIAKWGVDAQYDQAIEECAELIATLKHLKRGKVDQESVVNELADVYLMIGQLIYMFGPDRVDAAVQHKIDKLNNLLLTEG